MEISRNKLTTDFAKFDETDKSGGRFKKGMPDTIVIHYTASGSANSAINTFDANVKASAHLIMDTDENLTQMIPFHKIAWHAGRSFRLDRTVDRLLDHPQHIARRVTTDYMMSLQSLTAY